LIGRWNYSELRTEYLTDRFETSRALGKTLLFGPDVKAHFLQSEGAHKLKSMVGGDWRVLFLGLDPAGLVTPAFLFH
jgi:hypothetical protein